MPLSDLSYIEGNADLIIRAIGQEAVDREAAWVHS